MLEQARAAFENGWGLAQSWLLSPAAWSQFGLLIAAYGLSVLANRMIVPRVRQMLSADGRQIMVPNEHFITTRVTNYSDSGSPNRYAALFSVRGQVPPATAA